MSHTDAELIAEGRKVLALERSAIAATEAKLGDAFLRAVKLVLATHGNVIFCGVGKSGTSAANWRRPLLRPAPLRFLCTLTKPLTATSG